MIGPYEVYTVTFKNVSQGDLERIMLGLLTQGGFDSAIGSQFLNIDKDSLVIDALKLKIDRIVVFEENNKNGHKHKKDDRTSFECYTCGKSRDDIFNNDLPCIKEES